MEMKELSANELIEAARGCAGDLVGNACVKCAFRGGDCDCTTTLLLTLADKLEEANAAAGATATPHQSPTATASLRGEAFEDDYRLTARENGHAYFKKCFDEPCLGGGCNDNDCDLMYAVCERLCRYEEELADRWIDVKCAVPARDDEYLVMVYGAEKPTTLYFDVEENGFYEEDCDGETIWHSVTHWAELPAFASEEVKAKSEKVKRCATCVHEDRMAEEECCRKCENHSLWEQK